MKWQEVETFRQTLAISTLPLAKQKSYFTPFLLASVIPFIVAGATLGGSAFSSVLLFLFARGGGGHYEEKRIGRKNKGLVAGGRLSYNIGVIAMSKPRRQKFIRGVSADPLKLQPRDTTLLRDVVEFRFLNTAQILSLHEGSRRDYYILRLSKDTPLAPRLKNSLQTLSNPSRSI